MAHKLEDGALPENLWTRTCSPCLTHHLDPGREDPAGCQSDPVVLFSALKLAQHEGTSLDSC